MELFQKKIGPVFLKEDSDATVFIDKMHQLESKATSPELKQEIQKQIKLASYGAIGEQNIAYELKNSGMDMYILHDICLEHEDLTAQIDSYRRKQHQHSSHFPNKSIHSQEKHDAFEATCKFPADS